MIFKVYAPHPAVSEWTERTLNNWLFSWNYQCIAWDSYTAIVAAREYNNTQNYGPPHQTATAFLIERTP
jgi:hypothetical protein